MGSIFLALVTGLTSGGISCFAVQGGLLASALTQNSGQIQALSRGKRLTQVGIFLIFKIIAYGMLGFALGTLGSRIGLSPRVQGYLQILAGLFMLANVGRLLDIHPIFRYLVIQPPKWAYKLMKGQTQSGDYFAPAVLGALTVLIPCGVTQSMMALAIATANPLLGLGIMSTFVIGTSPIFFLMGMAAAEMLRNKAFVYISSLAIFALGILAINTGVGLTGSAYTVQNFWKAATNSNEPSGNIASLQEGKQTATIFVASSGYTSKESTLKANIPVILKLVTNNTFGCSRAFTIPQLNISKILPQTGTTIVEFTPTKPGRLAYTCSMGMYTGSFNVIP